MGSGGFLVSWVTRPSVFWLVLSEICPASGQVVSEALGNLAFQIHLLDVTSFGSTVVSDVVSES